MITVNKLLTLKERTRIRKISMVLSENAHKARLGQEVDFAYINSILPLADLPLIEKNRYVKEGAGSLAGGADSAGDKSEGLSEERSDSADNKSADVGNYNTDNNLRLSFKLEDYAQALLSRLGSEPSDWDFTDDSGSLDVSKRVIQDKILVLDRIRSPYNVGAIFRSADSFGIKEIVLIEGTASPLHPHARRTARGCTDTVKWSFKTEEEVLDIFNGYESSEIMALELGGCDVNTYGFPKRGIGVLGSEEFGVSPDILKRCGSRITIPMGGTKGSLNVSVSAGIFMQAWFART